MKVQGWKGWTKCPGEEGLKTKRDWVKKRVEFEKDELRPLRAYAEAFRRFHGRKVKLLDLFSGAGGQGYGAWLAGCDVTCVDINPRLEAQVPKVGGMSFICADAMTFPLEGYDVVLASTPCQAFSPLPNLANGRAPSKQPKLIKAMRQRLIEAKVPCWALENVSASVGEMEGCIERAGHPSGRQETIVGYCGSMTGNAVMRHRAYMLSFNHRHGLECEHEGCCLGGRAKLPRQRRTKQADGSVLVEDLGPCCSGSFYGCYGSITSWSGDLTSWRWAMGIPWMKAKALVQAIPPTFGQHVSSVLCMDLCKKTGVPEELVLEVENERQVREAGVRLQGVRGELEAEVVRQVAELVAKACAQGGKMFKQWVLELHSPGNQSVSQLYKDYLVMIGKDAKRVVKGEARLVVEGQEREGEERAPVEMYRAWHFSEHGPYTEDVCRAGGFEQLAGLYGPSDGCKEEELEKMLGKEPGVNWWIQPGSAQVEKAASWVRMLADKGGSSDRCTVVVPHRPQEPWWQQLKKVAEWRYKYENGTIMWLWDKELGRWREQQAVGGVDVFTVGERVVQWPTLATMSAEQMAGFEAAEKALAEPATEEEAVARAKRKYLKLELMVAGMHKWGFALDVIEMVEHGVRLGIERTGMQRREKHYPLSLEQQRFTHEETVRMEARGAVEWVSKPGCMKELASVQPWVVVDKPKMRGCMDFSATVNAEVQSWPFDLPRFLDSLQYIKKGSWVTTVDMSDGFWHVPVAEEDKRYMGFVDPGTDEPRKGCECKCGSLKGLSGLPKMKNVPREFCSCGCDCGRHARYMRAKALMFGLVSAPYWFSKFSEGCCAVLRRLGINALAFIDDIALFSDSKAQGDEDLKVVEKMMKDIGVDLAAHKTKPAAQQSTWLGVEVDTREGHECFRLPWSKVSKLQEELRQFKVDYGQTDNEWCEPLRLAQVIGRCCFAANVVKGGDTFLRRTYDRLKYACIDWKTGEVFRVWGQEPIQLDTEFWEDLRWWELNLFARNYFPMQVEGDVRCSLEGYSDASGLGAGASVKMDGEKEMLQVVWSDFEKGHDVNWQELAAVALVCEKWCERLAGKRLVLRVDNMATMYAVRRGTSKSPEMMVLVRRIVAMQARYHFSIEISHVAGVLNTEADGLSRMKSYVVPVAPRLRLDAQSRHMWARLWGGFDKVVGSEFAPRSSKDADSKPGRTRIWCHPRADKVDDAAKWVMDECERVPGTSAVLVAPYNPEAEWWTLLKKFHIVASYPKGKLGLEVYSGRQWKPISNSYSTVILTFPRAAGQHLQPVVGALLTPEQQEVYMVRMSSELVAAAKAGGKKLEVYKLAMDAAGLKPGDTVQGKFLCPWGRRTRKGKLA